MLFPGAASIIMHGIFLVGGGNNRRSPASCRRKNPMVPHEIKHGRRNQGCELSHKLQWLEHNVHCAVAPAMSETVQRPAIGQTPVRPGLPLLACQRSNIPDLKSETWDSSTSFDCLLKAKRCQPRRPGILIRGRLHPSLLAPPEKAE